MPSRLSREGVRRRGLDGVGDGQGSGGPAIDGDEDRRRAAAPEFVGGAGERTEVDPVLRQEPRVAQNDCMGLDRTQRTLAGRRVEVRHGSDS